MDLKTAETELKFANARWDEESPVMNRAIDAAEEQVDKFDAAYRETSSIEWLTLQHRAYTLLIEAKIAFHHALDRYTKTTEPFRKIIRKEKLGID